MASQSIRKSLSLITLCSLLFNLMSPIFLPRTMAMAAPKQEQASPAEQLDKLPKPALPVAKTHALFVDDPTQSVIDTVLSDMGLTNSAEGDLARLEPLPMKPQHFIAVPVPTVSIPTWSDPLAKLESNPNHGTGLTELAEQAQKLAEMMTSTMVTNTEEMTSVTKPLSNPDKFEIYIPVIVKDSNSMTTATPVITETPLLTITPTVNLTGTLPTITSTVVATSTPVVTGTITATPPITMTPTVTATVNLTGTPGITSTPNITITVTPTPTVIIGSEAVTTLVKPNVGGKIETDLVQITFAPHVAKQDTLIQYQPLATVNELLPNMAMVGNAFEIVAYEYPEGKAVHSFPHEVQLITDDTYLPDYVILTPSIVIEASYLPTQAFGIDTRTLGMYARANEQEPWQFVASAGYANELKVVAEVDHLTQFAVMGQWLNSPKITPRQQPISSTVTSTVRLTLDPDDDVGHAFWPGVGTVRELHYNMQLANGVKALFATNGCNVDILITRGSESEKYVSRNIRADAAKNFNSDLFVTLAFNALTGAPWGLERNGGVIGWTNNNDALVSAQYNNIKTFTGRPQTRGIQHPGFYSTFNALPANMGYTHFENLFLDHNYDWPVINTAFGNVVSATYTSIATQLAPKGLTCTNTTPDNPLGLPKAPSAEELKRLRDLGFQNYQKYGADPVSFSTGNYVYQLVLARMPGLGGLGFDFTLTQNSQDGRDSLTGFSWSMPYNIYAQHYDDDSVSVILHDGRTFHFTAEGEGYKAPAGVNDTLEKADKGYKYTQPDGTVLTFEEQAGGLALLTQWTTRQGGELTFTYNLGGSGESGEVMTSTTSARPALQSMKDKTGREVTFESDENGHITQMTLFDGRTFKFVYDDNGDLIEITDANGGTRKFEYDDKHRVTKHWDPENIMYLENIYDDKGRVIEQIDASGSHMFLEYGEGVTTFSDNLGHVSKYYFDDLKRVTAVEDAEGHREEYVYDDNYNVTSYKDKRGHTFNFTFDERGNKLSATDPNGGVTKYVYNEQNDLTSMTDALGRTTTYEYDGQGNLVKTMLADGTTVSATYNDYGNRLSLTDGNGHTTRYEYDDYGNLIKVTDPLGHETRYEYDLSGRQISMTDANGHTAKFEYDNNDNITQIVDPKGATSTFEYDKNDNLVKMSDRLGRVTTYSYDENLKLVEEVDPAGGKTSYDYDLMYNLINTIDPEGHETKYRYDKNYRLIEVENALGGVAKTGYDENGNIIKLVNENGATTTLSYDELNRVTKRTDALGFETSYGYDAVGNMVKQTNARGAVTTHEYDKLNRLTVTKDALGGTWTTVYDKVGNVLSQTDANGHTLTMAYDEANRLVKQTDANGYVTSFELDAVGNQTAMTNGRGYTTWYEYDDNDNMVTITDALQGMTRLEYDAEDNQTALIDAKGRVTKYEYDKLDRAVMVTENYNGLGSGTDTNVTTSYGYNKVGSLVKLTDANGNVTNFEFDALQRLIKQTDAENQVTQYSYDAVGNVTKLTNPRGFATVYEYDLLNQLVKQTDALSGVWQFVYDEVGNLVDKIDPLKIVTHYEYDLLDRMTSQSQNDVPPLAPPDAGGGNKTVDQNVTTRFEYDAVGNLRFVYDPRGTYQTEHRYDKTNHRILTIDAEKGETEFIFDEVYNLVKVIDGNDHATTITFDELNRRVKVTNPEGHAVQFELDAVGKVLKLTDARGNATTFEYDGMYRLVKRIDALKGEWLTEYDPMGNVLKTVDANGHANNSYGYDKVYRLLSSTDAEGYTTSMVYDENGNTITVTDGNGHVKGYRYDALDRLSAFTNGENETTRYEYDPLGNQTRQIEADGIVTRYDYDPLYRLVTVTQNYRADLGKTADTNVDTHYSYDEVGNLLRIVDAENHATQFKYDGMNRLVQEVNALGKTWDYQYDFVGNRTVRIDAMRHRTDYSYYPDNELKGMSYTPTQPSPESGEGMGGGDVSYSYDPNNNRVGMVDHLGTTSWVYDALNRLTDQSDPFKRHLGVQYDAVGNRTGLTYPDGRTVHYSYYQNDWLKTVIDPEENVTVYDRDGVGQMIKTLNPNSTVSEARYDKADRLLTVKNYQVGGAAKTNSAFSYVYDEVGQRTRMVAEYGWRKPSIVTSDYVYDGVRRLVRDSDSEGVWTEYTFDRVGNRLTLHTNDDSESPRPFDEKWLYYTYNEVNQLISVVGNTHPGSRGLKNSDNIGQLMQGFRHEVAAQRGRHVTAEAADKLLSMVDAFLNELYNGAGGKPGKDKPKPTATPTSDVPTSVPTDKPGNKPTATATSSLPTSAPTDKPGNKPTATPTSSGPTSTPTDKPGNNPKATATPVTAPTDSPIVMGSYSEAIQALRDQVMAYRDGGQIDGDGIENSLLVKLKWADEANSKVADKEWQTVTFSYDANGNRINKQFPGPQGPQIQGTDYRYDPENRLVSAWDYQSNLTPTQPSPATGEGNRIDRAITTLEYDGIGRRLVKTYDPKEGNGGAKRVEYVYDGLDPVAEYNRWNPQYENFYRGDMGRIITMQHFPSGTQGQMFWYHYDGLGSVSGLTKQKGQSTHNYRYEPYGQIEMPPGNFTDPHNHYTFTGQELDENMGLHEFYARAYDYSTGTWLQQDVYRGELVEPKSLHRYGYVMNAPTNYVDAYGFCVFGFKCPKVIQNAVQTVKNVASQVWNAIVPKVNAQTTPTGCGYTMSCAPKAPQPKTGCGYTMSCPANSFARSTQPSPNKGNGNGHHVWTITQSAGGDPILVTANGTKINLAELERGDKHAIDAYSEFLQKQGEDLGIMEEIAKGKWKHISGYTNSRSGKWVDDYYRSMPGGKKLAGNLGTAGNIIDGVDVSISAVSIFTDTQQNTWQQYPIAKIGDGENAIEVTYDFYIPHKDHLRDTLTKGSGVVAGTISGGAAGTFCAGGTSPSGPGAVAAGVTCAVAGDQVGGNAAESFVGGTYDFINNTFFGGPPNKPDQPETAFHSKVTNENGGSVSIYQLDVNHIDVNRLAPEGGGTGYLEYKINENGNPQLNYYALPEF